MSIYIVTVFKLHCLESFPVTQCFLCSIYYEGANHNLDHENIHMCGDLIYLNKVSVNGNIFYETCLGLFKWIF